jgi:hypothetical protein
MTPNNASSTIPGNPDSILELMKLPAFQNLLAKVETNFYRNRPKEAAELELEGTIRFTLQERAAQAWEILAKARATGLPMEQAQELISELVYITLPKAVRKDMLVKVTPAQEPLLQSIAERGELLSLPMSDPERPDPTEDNWLKLDSDACAISLDARLESLP